LRTLGNQGEAGFVDEDRSSCAGRSLAHAGLLGQVDVRAEVHVQDGIDPARGVPEGGKGGDPGPVLVLVDPGLRGHPIDEGLAKGAPEGRHDVVVLTRIRGASARHHEVGTVGGLVELRQRVDRVRQVIGILDGGEDPLELPIGSRLPGVSGLDLGVEVGVDQQRTRPGDVEEPGAERGLEGPRLDHIDDAAGQRDSEHGDR
jgi:hypothetical protein